MNQTCKVILEYPYEHGQWLEKRRHGIGGSDAAAILGLSRYNDPLSVYLEKSGQVTNDEDEPGPESPMWWGHQLEDDIAKAFRIETGLWTCHPDGMYGNLERPWQYANLDRLVKPKNGLDPLGPLEIKTTGLWHADEWADGEVPAAALTQLQHQLAVTGLPRGWLACLIGGQQFVVREVERDDELIKKMCDVEMLFWRGVQRRIPPAPNGSASAREAIARWFPEENPCERVLLTLDECHLLDEYRECGRIIRNLETHRERYKQKIQVALGEAEFGYDGEREIVRWRKVTPRRWDTKALEHDHPYLMDQYKKPGKPYRRFTVTDPMEDDK